MIDFVIKYGFNKYSIRTTRKMRIIKECLKRIGLKKGTCCEFGSADGYFCSNTRLLIDNGWKGVMLEAANGQFVTPDNVNQLVPSVDVLSIDIDGMDYEVWKAYDKKPAIVIIEVNSSFPPDVYHFSPEQGCSYALMNKLGEDKGYFLLCHTGNMVFHRQ
jgi:hypothetical protein